MNYYQHPSAIVDEGAQIGENSRVWHFVHVCGGPGSVPAFRSARMCL